MEVSKDYISEQAAKMRNFDKRSKRFDMMFNLVFGLIFVSIIFSLGFMLWVGLFATEYLPLITDALIENMNNA